MKKTRILSFLLAALLLLLPLSGCLEKPTADESVEGPKLSDLTPTDRLVLYLPGSSAILLRDALDVYQKRYPDVSLDIVTVFGYEEYNDRVMGDLAGGNGPDVLFLEFLTYMDVEKTALNHNFLDLTDVLASDPDFHADAYLNGVFDSARIGGRLYSIPVSFIAPMLVSIPAKLEEVGFRLDRAKTMSGFIEEAARVTPTAEAVNAPVFMQMMGYKNYFHRFLMYSGIRLLDYENGRVLPDEKALREFLQAYKTYFPYDYDGTGAESYGGYNDLQMGVSCFINTMYVEWMKKNLNAMKEKGIAYRFDAMPGQNGKPVGVLYQSFAIRANSENTLNAYNFVKMMLTEEMQLNQYLVRETPILKSAIRTQIDHSYTINDSSGKEIILDGADVMYPELTGEERDSMYEKIVGIDQFRRDPSVVLRDWVFESMLPFFRDEQSYEDCLKKLKNTLTFYLSE